MSTAINFLDKDATQFLVGLIKAHIDQKTQINIVTSIDENSSNQQVPGAQAVFNAITAALADVGALHYEVVATLPAAGESNVIYLLRIAEGQYSMHIYSGDQWRNIGTTDIDLSAYWAKAELAAMSNTDVQDIWDDVMGA